MPKIKTPNRLAQEKSPYLLQHANNPVDWYPWGEEAFAKAQGEDKPIFLSIGYSTCHWCHVMERESFEDQEVADLINEYFVAVKVDREERPDVDQIYMTVCQAMTGQGGWPLTIIMTPEKKPFFAGTYFPKHSKWGRPGVMDLLRAVQEKWAEDREILVASSEEITQSLQESRKDLPQEKLTAATTAAGYRQLQNDFDPGYGGFGGAPKFPTPHNLLFLLRYGKRTREKMALEIVEKTLQGMRQGGMYDHLGYGFSRYSVDEKWLVPHFEKMLYDNALLTYAYLEAYQATGKKEYAQVAIDVLTYVNRDMTNEQGGFYSAEDADSEGEEGKFYVWQQQEIIDLLGPEEGKLFCDFYGVTPKGNFEHETTVLNQIGKSLKEFAQEMNRPLAEIETILEKGREKLFRARKKRIHPYKDDKILTAWNGLMIAACAKAGAVLQRDDYKELAARAVEFIYQNLTREDGRLLARYREGEAAFLAYLDDYAFLLWGLLELYEATFNLDYLRKALALAEDMQRLFWDEEAGGYYFYGVDGEELIARPKEIYDGAMPSGNSVAAFNLFRLAAMTGQEKWEKLASQTLDAFAHQINKYPRAYTYFLMAVEWQLAPHGQIVLVGHGQDEKLQQMMFIVQRKFQPGTVLLWNDLDRAKEIARILPQIKEQQMVNNKATAYICENFSCLPPITGPKKLAELLN